ncbi:hypothetical protein [Paenibacillus harenae]|uniref:hypothetical protein n=1 Tax=Paenibacillus harenae TaxID=306543 RepID=UPI000418F502|nr:hypothetical protein [Paenibacillus harenae]
MKTTAEHIRETIDALFRSAGYSAPELLEYIEKLELENGRLTQAVRKLRLDSVRRTSSDEGMNSRLKDALRE